MTRIRVRLRIYSGRPSPTVELDGDASAPVLEALAPAAALGDEDPGPPPSWHLGYRGLLVEQLNDPDPRLPPVFEFATDALQGPGLDHRVAESFTDERLLAPDGPIGRELPEEALGILPRLLRIARAAPRTAQGAAGNPPEPCGSSAPLADLAWWNDGAVGGNAHQYYNNCYNYATNQRTDTFAVPGRGSGLTLTIQNLSGERVRLYAWYDNLYDSPAGFNGCPLRGHLVALAYAPSRPDFHWWRKNQDGYWTHKPGEMPVDASDESGQPIVDPRECNRGDYTVWVGFMAVVPGRPRIE